MINRDQHRRIVRAYKIAKIHKQQNIVYTEQTLTEKYKFGHNELTKYNKSYNE